MPLLFRTEPRQRILIALARLGTLRMNDAVRLSGGSFPGPTEFANFEKTGLCVRFGSDRTRLIALNPGYPAADKLRDLLMALPAEPMEKRLPSPSIDVPSVPIRDWNALEIFGPRTQTTVVIAVCLSNGQMDATSLRNIVRRGGALVQNFTNSLNSLQARGVIVVENTMVSLDPTIPKARLIAFVETLLKNHLEHQNFKREPQRPVTDVRDSVNSRIPWRAKPKGRIRPVGMEASADGAPLLFGSNARFRTLTALAVHQPLPPNELLRITQLGRNTLANFAKAGFVVVEDYTSGRYRRLVHINPAIPAHDELIRLLVRLESKWPSKTPNSWDLQRRSPGGKYEWDRGLFKYFGSENRTETLLMLASFGRADNSTIHRALPAYDRHEGTRTFDMLRHYGIVRYSTKEGNARMVELDPDWFAARELRAILDALLTCDPRFEGKKYASESAMSSRRKKMRQNATERD